MDCEEIINEVHKYPILYDTSHSDYKNNRLKDQVWDTIGKKLGTSGENVKKRWKGLKDCYSKHLRSEKTHTGQKAKLLDRYKTWPWANQMSIFKRFFQLTPTDSNVPYLLDGTENSLSTQTLFLSQNLESPATTDSAPTFSPTEPQHSTATTMSTTETIEPSFDVLFQNVDAPAATTVDYNHISSVNLNEPSTSRRTLNTAIGSKAKSRSSTQHVSESSTNTVLNYLKNRNATRSNYDELDLICLGYAKTIKKFSTERQAIVKFEMAKLIMEQELAHIRERSPVSERSTLDISEFYSMFPNNESSNTE